MTCGGRPGGRNRRSGKGSGVIAWRDLPSRHTWKRAIKGREKRARTISRRVDILSSLYRFTEYIHTTISEHTTSDTNTPEKMDYTTPETEIQTRTQSSNGNIVGTGDSVESSDRFRLVGDERHLHVEHRIQP